MKNTSRILGFAALLSFAFLLAACASGASSSSPGGFSSGGNGSTGTQASNNSTQLVVDSGPFELNNAGVADEDVPFITVTVCVPGTATCQNIDHVEVDTGSEGLRLVAPALSLSLPQ